MKFSLVSIAVFSAIETLVESAIVFDTSTIADGVSLLDFEFKSRKLFPAGPGLMGYGLGALEQIAYDSSSDVLYGMSERGFVNIFTFTENGFQDLNLSIDFEGATLTDVEVCGGFLFISLLKGTDPGEVRIFEALKKNEQKVPDWISTATVGVGPDMIKPNSDCTILAVANEGEGDYNDFLVDPVEVFL